MRVQYLETLNYSGSNFGRLRDNVMCVVYLHMLVMIIIAEACNNALFIDQSA